MTYATIIQLRRIDAYVAVYDKHIATLEADDILIVHVTEVDFRSGIDSIARIAKFEFHIFHIFGNLLIAHTVAFNERLFNNNLEVPFRIASETKYRECRLREISIV